MVIFHGYLSHNQMVNLAGLCWVMMIHQLERRPFGEIVLPSGYVKIAIENDHLWWIYPLKMGIFHSYVSLPEGNSFQTKFITIIHHNIS